MARSVGPKPRSRSFPFSAMVAKSEKKPDEPVVYTFGAGSNTREFKEKRPLYADTVVLP